MFSERTTSLTQLQLKQAEQSAEILDGFTQTERTSEHSANWLRHCEQADAIIDLESDSLLLKKAYSSTLSNYLPPSCRKHDLELIAIQFEIDEQTALGSLKRMKHVMTKVDQFDTLYNKRWESAKAAAGLLVGAAGYWEPKQQNYQANQSCSSRFISRPI